MGTYLPAAGREAVRAGGTGARSGGAGGLRGEVDETGGLAITCGMLVWLTTRDADGRGLD